MPAEPEDRMAAQQEKTTALLRWVYGIEGDPQWQARRVFIKPLLSGTEFVLEEQSPRGTGQAGGILPPEQTLDVIHLQRAMATEKGTWLDAMLTVTSDGTGDARFNYTHEPAPLVTEVGYPVDELRAHLEAYPRTDDTLEPWMKERLA